MPAGVIAECRRDPLCHLVAQRADRIVGAVDVTARHRQVSDAASGRLTPISVNNFARGRAGSAREVLATARSYEHGAALP
jgi:hypothetical protein